MSKEAMGPWLLCCNGNQSLLSLRCRQISASSHPSSRRQGTQSLAKPVWIEATDRAIAASLAKQQEQNHAEPMGPPWPRPNWTGSHRQTLSRATEHYGAKSGDKDNGALAKPTNQLPQAKGRNQSKNYPPRGRIGQASQPKGTMCSQPQAS